MKSLVCVMVGDGSVFVVDIDEREKVGHLKEMITEKNRYPLASKDLKLYVAKKGGSWLKTSDPNVKQLEEGDVPAQIKDIMKKHGEMDASYCVRSTAFGFPDEEDAGDGDIHIIVDIPEHIKKHIRLLRDNQLDESQEFPVDSGLSLASAWDWLAAFFSSPRKASPSKKDV